MNNLFSAAKAVCRPRHINELGRVRGRFAESSQASKGRDTEVAVISDDFREQIERERVPPCDSSHLLKSRSAKFVLNFRLPDHN
jgi:hypothetical protein